MIKKDFLHPKNKISGSVESLYHYDKEFKFHDAVVSFNTGYETLNFNFFASSDKEAEEALKNINILKMHLTAIEAQFESFTS